MQQPVDNSDLCALLDEECSPARRARIEAQIAGSPPCAERLAAWRRNDAAVRVALCTGGTADYERGPAAPAPLAGRKALRDVAPLTAPPLQAKTSSSSGLTAAAFAVLAGGSGAAALALAVLVLAGR